MFSKRTVYLLLFAFMVAFPLGMVWYKLKVLDYPLASIIPAVSHQIELSMDVDGHGNNISVSTYLPKTDYRQIVSEEQNSSGIFTISLQSDSDNRLASWNASNVEGRNNIRYTFSVQTNHIRFNIPSGMPIPQSYPAWLAPYLKEEKGTQVNDPLILELIEEILPKEERNLLLVLTLIHRHLQDKFKNKNFSGYTDAITALKLGEASCNGKGRLFVAMARRLNIPARLVGGLIMESKTKRVSHQWVEIYINGHWVPFDTINDHFAELPGNYLTLYYDDLFLFKHTSNINFQYHYKMSKRLVPRREAQESLRTSSLNMLNFYAMFERIGISQNLLKIILMIPLGALVTVIFRNVIGLNTFGTFLPTLIAAAARDTGLVWGLAGFFIVIFLSSIIRRLLDWLQLLHSPKMAIMLTTVVITMLGVSLLGVWLNLFELAHITLFPIALMAITAERFAIVEEEQGFREAVKMMAVTSVVIAACYSVMESLFMQSMMLAFPELLFVLIALNLWLGKWIGIRVMEFARFRRLIFN